MEDEQPQQDDSQNAEVIQAPNPKLNIDLDTAELAINDDYTDFIYEYGAKLKDFIVHLQPTKPYSNFKKWFEANTTFNFKIAGWDQLIKVLIYAALTGETWNPTLYENQSIQANIHGMYATFLSPPELITEQKEDAAHYPLQEPTTSETSSSKAKAKPAPKQKEKTSEPELTPPTTNDSAMIQLLMSISTRLDKLEAPSTTSTEPQPSSSTGTPVSTHTLSKQEVQLKLVDAIKSLQTSKDQTTPAPLKVTPKHLVQAIIEQNDKPDGTFTQLAVTGAAKALLCLYERGVPLGEGDPDYPQAAILTATIQDVLSAGAYPHYSNSFLKGKVNLLKEVCQGRFTPAELKEAYTTNYHKTGRGNSWRGRGNYNHYKNSWASNRGGRGRGGRGRGGHTPPHKPSTKEEI